MYFVISILFNGLMTFVGVFSDSAANGAKQNAGHILKPTLSPAQQKIMAKKVAAKVKDPLSINNQQTYHLSKVFLL